ncbi:MAG: transposase [Candidatus Pacebacteria bacterium]|nr:transposase [Candidatus Paceibacterota bacterium]
MPLTTDQARIALILETVRIEEHVKDIGLSGGRPFYSMKPTARAFLVKSVLNVPTTKELIARLNADESLRTICGFVHGVVPSASTFSRHFANLSNEVVLDATHEALVVRHVGKEIVHHLSRDSSAIEGREKPQAKVKIERPPKRAVGRPAKGSEPVHKEPSRIEAQLTQDYETSLSQLPRGCGVGSKTNSKGHLSHWIGYKLHLDVADDGLPISAFTTSAHVHDSQVAIPLARMTSERVGGVFYETMDKAYDAAGIRQAIGELGHVPIIQPVDRGGRAVPLDQAQAERFKTRTTVERTFANLKDNHGGRFVRVRTPKKVHAHLMFGVLAIFALVLLKT